MENPENLNAFLKNDKNLQALYPGDIILFTIDVYVLFFTKKEHFKRFLQQTDDPLTPQYVKAFTNAPYMLTSNTYLGKTGTNPNTYIKFYELFFPTKCEFVYLENLHSNSFRLL